MKTRWEMFWTILVMGLSLGVSSKVFAQQSPLRAGSYRCFSLDGSTMAPDSSPRDVAWRRAHGMPDLEPGQRATPPLQVPTVMIIPAFFGNIAIDGKGTYRLTGTGHTGKYGYNSAAAAPTFTGDLSIMKVAQYDGRAGHFLLVYQTLTFECSLEGRVAAPPATPMPKPARLATLADFNGHFEGSYFCGASPSAMALDTKAANDGTLVGIYSFGGTSGEPKGSFTVAGKWTPKGFVLEPKEWIHQPTPTYSMVGLNGVLTTNGFAGKVVHPVCTNFDIARR
jgi:hypothetical protein